MKKPERAIYATTLKRIPRDGGYDRVYFGAEFCQWRMPAAASVARSYARARELGMGFTLVTPWVTDAGLGRLCTLFRVLSDSSSGDAARPEVVINDYGALDALKEGRYRLVPVLGRLLTRQKRCPRIPGIMERLPQSGRELYLHAGIEDPVSAKFLKGFGIRRVELDNPLQGIDVNLKNAGLKGTVYTPYAYVTVTRHCPVSFDGKTWRSFTGCRDRGCLRGSMEMSNPAHEAPLLMRGNAQFVMNPELPENLTGMGIDRIVFMEEVP